MKMCVFYSFNKSVFKALGTKLLQTKIYNVTTK